MSAHGEPAFFPKVKTCLIPVLCDIVEVIDDNGPQDRRCSVHLAVGSQPLGVCHEGNASERGTVPLRPEES